MDDGLEVLRILGIGLLGLCALLVAVAILAVLVDRAINKAQRRASRRRRRSRPSTPTRRRPSPRAAEPVWPAAHRPAYTHVLLVEADERAGRLEAVVEVATAATLPQGRLRLELVDRGVIRLTTERMLSGTSAVTSNRIELTPPVGVTPDEMLGWRWDVVLVDSSGERARWREHLSPAGSLDAEAELVFADHDSPGEPPSEAADEPAERTAEELMRRLRVASQDAGARR